MQSFAYPIVSAHFVAIGSPLDSFGATSWHVLAPTVASATTRAVSASVLAWRARYYAFRAARGAIGRGDRSAVVAALAGPHGGYVRARFTKLAATDARFNVAHPTPARAAPVEQSTSVPKGGRADHQKTIARTDATFVRDHFAGLAARLAGRAAPLEVSSTQNYTPKRGRQWAVKSHEAANLRRAEAAASALAAAWGEVAAGTLDASSIPFDLRVPMTMKDLCQRTATRGRSDSYYHYCDAMKPANDSPAAVALRAFVASRTGGGAAIVRQREADLAEAVFKLRGLNISGFFPTPPVLASRVIDAANITAGLSVLEPSAGLGDLADAARAAGGDVTACEILHPAADVLRLKGYGGKLHVGDFLELSPPDVGMFERVIMNPPFEKDAAAAHVVHAMQCLKPGGRLVAIVPASYARLTGDSTTRGPSAVLAERLASGAVASWTISEPIAEAFTGGGAFRSTGVSVCILVVVKADAGSCARDDSPELSTPTTPLAGTGKAIVDRDALRKAIRAVLAATPEPLPKSRRHHGDPTSKRLRIWTVDGVLRVGAFDHPGVPTIDLSGTQFDGGSIDVGIATGKTLLEILRLSAQDLTFSLELEGSELRVRGSDAEYKLFTVERIAA
jgi:SAM-dependent methyltransferase